MTSDINPLSAATHPDPYPFYEHLRVTAGLHYDQTLKVWIALGAADISAVLRHPSCRVRPASEPVPGAIAGTAAGAVFGDLARMNDGERHTSLKGMVSTALDCLNESAVEASAQRWSARLFRELTPNASGNGLTHFCYQLPATVMGELIGLPEAELEHITELVGSFIGCIVPGGGPEQVARGRAAAGELAACMSRQLEQVEANGPDGSVLAALADAARHAPSITRDQIIANSIGLLNQTYEATAGLIANATLMLARHPPLRELVSAEPALIRQFIRETARFDPSIQNTRRFVVEDSVVAGQHMRSGDTVVLILAAANRDPAENPDPERFNLGRGGAELYTFSRGIHACPGQQLAHTMASAALAEILKQGLDWDRLVQPPRYRASLNARVAELEMK